MLKNNRTILIITSVLILLPMIAGLLLWNNLPDAITTHWGADGNADGWSGKPFAVIGLPLIFLALHWLCILITAADPRNKNQNSKVFGMVLWIVPIASVLCAALVYTTALGCEVNPQYFTSVMLGLMFIIFGNYLPKCRQNSTIGIKIKWTLLDEENWNHTHRFASKLWVIGGILILVTSFLPETIAFATMLIVLLPLAFVPMIYSYILYRQKFGRATIAVIPSPYGKRTRILSVIFLILLLIFILIFMFIGDVEYQYNDASFTVQATYWNTLTVDYTAIDTIEYRETTPSGSRTNGFASVRLLLGTFHNNDFGYYTRYTYAQTEPCVILTVGDKTLLLNGKDPAATQAIYNELSTRISK